MAIALGDNGLHDIATFAGLEDDDFTTARNAPNIPLIQKVAVNRVYLSVKMKYGLSTTIVAPSTVAAAAAAQPAAPQQLETEIGCYIAKVKLGQVLHQAIGQDVLILPGGKLRELRSCYEALRGDEPMLNLDVSDAQRAAL